jgi:hypothetical protein
MLRPLIFIATLIFFRTFVMRPRDSVRNSPYRNALDGQLSGEQLSALVDEIRLRKPQPDSCYPRP